MKVVILESPRHTLGAVVQMCYLRPLIYLGRLCLEDGVDRVDRKKNLVSIHFLLNGKLPFILPHARSFFRY